LGGKRRPRPLEPWLGRNGSRPGPAKADKGEGGEAGQRHRPSGGFGDVRARYATGGAGSVDEYSGATGPFSFGSGVFTGATTGTGDLVGIQVLHGEPSGFVFVPTSYGSDSRLSDTATYAGQTFSSLGATPGKYEWTWGPGANQTFTLEIGNAVPEPSTWAMMIAGFGLLGLLGYRKTRSALA
jgi:hypothetical protein